MKITLHPGRPLRGVVSLPGDKSISHRAALLGAIAEGMTCLDNFLLAGVTEVTLKALAQLGIRWGLEGTRLTVEGKGLHGLRSSQAVLDCASSAATMRLLAGLLAQGGLAGVLDGSAVLRRRPMARVVDPLRSMGVPISSSDGGLAPLRLTARPRRQALKSMHLTLPVASAQVKSAILIAGLAAEGPVSVREPGPSRDHTERLLQTMGVQLRRNPAANEVTLFPPSDSLRPLKVAIPGDLSSAAFLIVAALISPGSELLVRNVGLNPSRTGFLEVLARMGAEIEVAQGEPDDPEPVGDLVVRHSALKGVEVEGDLVVRMIDEFPALAVAASYAEGRTTVRHAAELRLKESDRIASLCQELAAQGVRIRERWDGFVIVGGKPLRGGRLHSHGDHRVAMALAAAGTAAADTVTVEGAESVLESYPGFIGQLSELGAAVEVH